MAKMSSGLRILVVDDEKTIRRFLKTSLSAQGHRIFEAADAKSTLVALEGDHPDVVILDLGLPDLDGIELTKEIRSRSALPIIIVSVREQESDKIAALDAGADDYLTKPFSAPELAARLRAVMRRGLPEKEQVFKTGDLIVDIGKRQVRVQDKPVQLTPTEYDVLKMLVSRAGKVVTRSQLFKEIWNKSEGVGRIDHLLRVTVSNLRGKIEPDAGQPTYILTEPGVGYRLSVIEEPAA